MANEQKVQMTTKKTHALLPEGLNDLLPEEAAFEAKVVEALLSVFSGYGYSRVKPPLIEFEESMLADAGQALENNMFRVMDPQSQRMLCLRSDMTPQVARIASSRLGSVPRPLRLSYAGEVLRIKGNQLRPERQFLQAGFELVGREGVDADVEVIILAADSLQQVGIKELSIDITTPTLVPSICAELGFDSSTSGEVRKLLDRKDLVALEEILPRSGMASKLLPALLNSAGPVDETLKALSGVSVGDKPRSILDEVELVVARVREAMPELAITLDLGEYRGFEYHTGLGFTVFSRGVRGELGRGGRYSIVNTESATGFSVYLDSVLRAVSTKQEARRVLVLPGVDVNLLKRMRGDGWQTVTSLGQVDDMVEEAKRLGCGFVLINDNPCDINDF